jgi:Mrp family chromosome partitioning ATPase
MQDWRNRFEFVIIDTPPIAACADALTIATLAGNVLTVSRAKKTAHKDMREMLRRLGPTQSRILGAVINKF